MSGEPGPLLGTERFAGIDATVRDFWRFAMSDLRTNTQRGYLAEYLVRRALGLDGSVRREWDAWDAETPDGLRIEVKASGRVQAWRRARTTTRQPTWHLGPTLAWDYRTGEYVGEKKFHADVYVFALQSNDDPATYDAFGCESVGVHRCRSLRARILPTRAAGKDQDDDAAGA